uniref:Sphingomyelin synthase-like domain-containing protein n=1 Tax=Pyrodinium bahamense TaxID=73915 RepID=A0A7S0AAA3_9DINO
MAASGSGGLGGLGERDAAASGSRRGAAGQGTGPTSGYAPADSMGNFRLPTDSDTTDSGQARIDYDELEYDPSERRPGGPVAEAVWAAGPQARRRKWAAPLLAFLAALLLQSLWLHAATQRYVLWLERLGRAFSGGAGAAGPHGRTAGPHVPPAELLGPRDNIANWLGPSDSSKLPLDIVAGAVPCVWLAVVVGQRNLRLWTHTLLAGSLLVALKGFCAWVTLVPDPAGGEDCLDRLHPQARSHFQRQGGFPESIPIVLWLWVQDLVAGMRSQRSLVCAGGFSGPSCVCTLFSLGLYDATRIRVRKMRPHFRTLYHVASAVLLSIVVLVDAGLDLAARRQTTLDVVLALVLALLLYGSPVVAMSADRFLLQGCPVDADVKAGCDAGDVVVPPCCLPFCCLHGRYFLHAWPASQARQALRAQTEAKKVAEDFRMEQQEAARVGLELEAQLESVRQRSQLRRRQDEAEAERRFSERAAEAQRVCEQRLAKELKKLEAQTQVERQKAAEFEEKASVEAARFVALEAQHAQERRSLEEDVAAARGEVEAAREALRIAREQAEQQELDVLQLRQSVEDLGAFDAVKLLGAGKSTEFKADSGGGPLTNKPELGALAATDLAVPEAVKDSSDAAAPDKKPAGEAAVAAESPPASPEVAAAAASPVGDFRSLPPAFWAACHGRFAAAGAAAAAAWAAEATALVAEVPPMVAVEARLPSSGDFRTAPEAYWAVLHGCFSEAAMVSGAPGTDAALAAGEAAPAPELPYVAASLAALSSDFRSCPRDYWMALHDRFGE